MNKSIVIFVTILALISFGTASSALAFEPISAITLIVGGTTMAIAALKDKHDERQAEACAQLQDQKGDQSQKEARNETDNAGEDHKDLALAACKF